MQNDSTSKACQSYALAGLSRIQAYSLAKALELYSRVTIGQLAYIGELARFRQITGAAGEFAPIENINEADRLLDKAKYFLTRYEPNASRGIGSPETPNGNIAWEISKALKHRLAWDAAPTGGFGVDFSDPYTLKYSAEPRVELIQEEPLRPQPSAPAAYSLRGLSGKQLKVISTALDVAVNLMLGQFECVLQMVAAGDLPTRAGGPATPEDVDAAGELLYAAKALVTGLGRDAGKTIGAISAADAQILWELRNVIEEGNTLKFTTEPTIRLEVTADLDPDVGA